MQLSELHLVNFRNYPEADLAFGQSIVVFTGNNGSGKTNLLDAIHYLAFCKSFLNPIDSQNIRNEEPFFVVQGSFQNEESKDAVYCGIKRGQKKQFKRNSKEYERLSEHIGLFPLVVISPSDIALITEGSEERRRFMDSVISQYDKPYLEHLIRYGKILQQRNAYLRQGNSQADMLEIWDEQLAQYARPVFEARKLFLARIKPLFQQVYSFISNSTETVELTYESKLFDADPYQLLQQTREKDQILQYTTAGIHKDDLGMLINGFPLRKYASQGQQKSFLIALKLAQFDVLSEVKQMKPLLLLDDIFEKLDQDRITALMTLVSQQHFGQIFITDSHPERIAEILRGIQATFDHFTVHQGTVQSA
ncbi:MAG TPA: DNA replication/repair protein RecF [Flavobacteriales bacterium]|nr:DNA replication/repair protein RecF [Flavobacteriales bacterium]HPH81694.1 DNA replication/repair protein RecF [Flavobacteriales bacterium]